MAFPAHVTVTYDSHMRLGFANRSVSNRGMIRLEHRTRKVATGFGIIRCSNFMNLKHLIRVQTIPFEGGML